MEANSPLSELADIHLPPSISFWPPAFGWWFLLSFLLVIVAWTSYVSFRYWQQKQRMAAALEELDVAFNLLQKGNSDNSHQQQINTKGLQFLMQTSSVIKRVSMQLFPDLRVAPLHGEQWLTFLENQFLLAENQQVNIKVKAKNPLKEKTTPEQEENLKALQAIALGEYMPTYTADSTRVHAVAHQWVQFQYKHKTISKLFWNIKNKSLARGDE
jgi:hypothetical protein